MTATTAKRAKVREVRDGWKVSRRYEGLAMTALGGRRIAELATPDGIAVVFSHSRGALIRFIHGRRMHALMLEGEMSRLAVNRRAYAFVRDVVGGNQ